MGAEEEADMKPALGMSFVGRKGLMAAASHDPALTREGIRRDRESGDRASEYGWHGGTLV